MRLLILLMMTALSCFLLKLNSHHPYRFASRFQQTLTQNHRASRNWYSLNNMLKRLAFKWLLNKLLLEIEWSEVKLIWWFISIIFTRSFRKFAFLIYLFKTIPLVISTTFQQKLSLFHLQISFQPQGVTQLLLIFFQFQPGVAYKSIAYKKNLIKHLFLKFVNEEIFFQYYIEMESKTLFILFEEFFEKQK